MSSLIEDDLREFYRSYDSNYDAASALERLRSASAEPPRHRVPLWACLAACGTCVTAAITAAIVALTAGAAPAYAGWSATPGTLSPPRISTLATDCHKSAGIATNSTYPNGYDTGVVFTGAPVLTETRGVFTAAIYVTNRRVYRCLYGSKDGAWIGADQSGGPVHAAPSGDTISAPYGTAFGPAEPNSGAGGGGSAGIVSPWLGRLQHQMAQQKPGSPAWQSLAHQFLLLHRGGGYGLDAYGQAGADVTAAVFSFGNGQTVTATVENGWYFAWWPWTSYPTSVQVTTSSGTTSSPMTTTGVGVEQKASPDCQPGTPHCVFTTTVTPSSSQRAEAGR